MTLTDKIKEYELKKASLEKDAKDIKIELRSHFMDQSIDLAQRWDTFEKTSLDFKNNEGSLINASSKGLNYVMDNFLEHYGRGKVLDFTELLGECINDGNFHPDMFARRDQYNKPLSDEKALILLKEALEEILSRNYGTFVYDW